MKETLALLRKSQWRWDFAVASHGASFHAPQEMTRILSHALEYALKAQVEITRTLAKLGHLEEVPMPDISTKEKAQEYLGLDMAGKVAAKEKFLQEIRPKWLEDARSKGKVRDDAYTTVRL